MSCALTVRDIASCRPKAEHVRSVTSFRTYLPLTDHLLNVLHNNNGQTMEYNCINLS